MENVPEDVAEDVPEDVPDDRETIADLERRLSEDSYIFQLTLGPSEGLVGDLGEETAEKLREETVNLYKKEAEIVRAETAKNFREELLKDVKYILENLGTAADYYNKNPDKEPVAGVAERLEKFQTIFNTISTKDNEWIISDLYRACNPKQQNKKALKEFYTRLVQLLTNTWSYGDRNHSNPGALGEHSAIFQNFIKLEKLLETGKYQLPNELAKKYSNGGPKNFQDGDMAYN